MLFRKNIDPRCAYCAKGSRINDEQVVCVKRGVVPASDHCGAFSYDPLKRVPPSNEAGRHTADGGRFQAVTTYTSIK